MINHFNTVTAAAAHLTAKRFVQYHNTWINSDRTIIARIFVDPGRGPYIYFMHFNT